VADDVGVAAGVAAVVGATVVRVVACGAVAGGDDELHAESVAARASTDAGAMNMVSFKSFFPLLILSAVTISDKTLNHDISSSLQACSAE
jgi:hypothetical protein